MRESASVQALRSRELSSCTMFRMARTSLGEGGSKASVLKWIQRAGLQRMAERFVKKRSTVKDAKTRAIVEGSAEQSDANSEVKRSRGRDEEIEEKKAPRID